MTTKTIKTILFASLIAAMILPFSVMEFAQAAPNENANDKAKENTAKKYHVEVLSKEIIDESIEDGVKVVKYKQKIRQLDIPTLKDFMDDNQEYINFLESKYGEEGKKMVAKEIAKYAKFEANFSEDREFETVKYGDHSITFIPVTQDFWGTWKDPINMVFKGDGRASEVKSKIDYNAPHSWHSAAGWTQYAFIDETSHGGSAYWQSNNFQLEEGDWDDRYHLRIFNGGDDSHGEFDYWSIGAVHRETWSGTQHVLYSDGWEIAESHLKSDLSSTSGILSVGSMWLANSGTYGSPTSAWNGGAGGLIGVQ